MSDKLHGYERDAFRVLKEALSPNASVRPQNADTIIVLEGGQKIHVGLKLWPQASPDHEVEHGRRVWVLLNATSTLRDRLRRERESFVDLQGAVFLAFPNLLVDRVNVKSPARSTAAPRSFDPFADRSSLVARTLLESANDRQRSWGVRELAEAAGVGPATVTRSIRGLERRRVVQVRRPGRDSEIRLTDARALFTLWTGAYDWTRNHCVAVHAPVGDPLRFMRRLTSTLGPHRWALTLQSGASLVAPLATWERIHAYVDVPGPEALMDIAERAGWPVSGEGRLVLMRPYYRDSVWHNVRKVDDLPVVSDLQLALDLWHYPLRGREQAEHIVSTKRLLG